MFLSVIIIFLLAFISKSFSTTANHENLIKFIPFVFIQFFHAQIENAPKTGGWKPNLKVCSVINEGWIRPFESWSILDASSSQSPIRYLNAGFQNIVKPAVNVAVRIKY